MADIAQVLWSDFLRHNPGNPLWVDRDRFVLSNGHGSMLLYSLLYLTGYPLGLEEIKNFRQFGSRTAGHPEHEPALGIETTTGPLGPGPCQRRGDGARGENARGPIQPAGAGDRLPLHVRVCRRRLPHGRHFARGLLVRGYPGAGQAQGLGKLIVFYDDNGISIDGKVSGWFGDDTAKRFEAYQWHVVPHVDGNDAEAVLAAVQAARAETTRPSLICCKTIIGWGAPNKQGTAATHGEALGADEIAATRKAIGWPYEPFVVPDALRSAWDHRRQGAAAEAAWRELFGRYRTAHPELAREFDRRVRGELAQSWKETAAQCLEAMLKQTAPQATRQASQAVLNLFGPALTEILGGSADLTPSNNTLFKGARTVSKEDASGNYIHYGVREFGMTAVMNGISLHGGFVPYGGTFLVFSDYARNAIRLACLMSIRVVLVYTHDSIGLGEDGPTHQPVEHLTSLRAIPNMSLWRPCDAAETAIAWTAGIERHGPTALIFTRQALPQQPRTPQQVANIRRGGYTLIDASGTPECIVIATGSEVGIAAEAVNTLNASGRRVRLVSMPSTEAFDAQDEAYRESVLPAGVRRRLAVEAGATLFWWRYVGLDGRVLGIDRFGASGKASDLLPHFGFTADNVARQVSELLGSRN